MVSGEENCEGVLWGLSTCGFPAKEYAGEHHGLASVSTCSPRGKRFTVMYYLDHNQAILGLDPRLPSRVLRYISLGTF